jgi:Ras family protein
VEESEGKALAAQWNCTFTESSARANENVARIFELMVGEVEKEAPFQIVISDLAFLASQP